MGILDDAIRDHLDLKRRRGAEEPELKRLEDEAFGPQGRPDASGSSGPTASALAEAPAQSQTPEITPADLGLESLSETPPPDGPTPEEPPPAPEPTGEGGPTPELTGEGGLETSSEGGQVVFHDFAAEEGLVSSGADPSMREPSPSIEPSDPVERALAQPTPEQSDTAPPADSEPEATEAQPAEEAKPEVPAPPVSEDTQVHDMAKELDAEPEEPPSEETSQPAPAGETEAGSGDEPVLELDMEELDIDLDEEAASGDAEGSDADGEEDVLEETPEFLRDAPDSDRLWFEQGKPKDFDFDED